MPVVLRVRAMPQRTEAEARRLLRLLFLRNGAVPARSAARQSRTLLRLTRAGLPTTCSHFMLAAAARNRPIARSTSAYRTVLGRLLLAASCPSTVRRRSYRHRPLSSTYRPFAPRPTGDQSAADCKPRRPRSATRPQADSRGFSKRTSHWPIPGMAPYYFSQR